MPIKTFFTISASSIEDFYIKLENQCSKNPNINSGIIFASADINIEILRKNIVKKISSFIGLTTAREFFEGEIKEKHFVGVFFYLPNEVAKTFEDTGRLTYALGKKLGKSVNETFENSGIYILGASITSKIDKFVLGIQDATNKNIPLYGGLALDDFKYEDFCVFTNNGIIKEGYACFAFDCNIVKIIGDAFSGWNSIGATHTVTKSYENELVEIDNQSALDLFSFYFDYIDFDNLQKEELGSHPIKVIEADEATHIKATLDVNFERKSLVFNCELPVGTRFQFCNFPDVDIKHTYIKRLEKLNFHKEDVDFILACSCAGRFFTLGPIFKQEVHEIYKLCSVPIVGFLAFGEIGNIRENNISYFHNYTNILVGFKLTN